MKAALVGGFSDCFAVGEVCCKAELYTGTWHEDGPTTCKDELHQHEIGDATNSQFHTHIHTHTSLKIVDSDNMKNSIGSFHIVQCFSITIESQMSFLLEGKVTMKLTFQVAQLRREFLREN